MSKKRNRNMRSRIGVTTILIAIFLVALFAGLFSIYKIRENKTLDISISYNTQGLSYTEVVDNEIQTGKGITENLCIMADDVPNSNIEMEDNSIGGLFNLDANKVIFSKSAFDRVYPASITKVMTGILAEKYGNMDDIVTITTEDIDLEEGSQMVGFEAGDTVSMYELFHGLLIHSGNDAAMAIARHIGGSVQGFVDLMNKEAYELGCFNTHFMNPSGLHDASHYTSVYDVYLMLNSAISYPLFSQAMQLSVYNLTYTKADGTEVSINLDSTDKYLTKAHEAPKGITVLGGKTGTTSLAGHCLALVSQNSYGEPHISIVLRSNNKDSLYRQMDRLMEVSNM